jgi:N-acetylglutamate synthase-like GNAT family acetyltransferase
MQAVIRKAVKQDLGSLIEFLLKANLGTDGVTAETIEYFLLVEDEFRKIKGSLGMVAFENCGLLRSLVVSAGQAEKEIFILFTQMLELAKEKGIRHLYLATNKTGAVPFFDLLGFQTIERDEIPSEFHRSEHIRQILNVDNSLFLKFTL